MQADELIQRRGEEFTLRGRQLISEANNTNIRTPDILRAMMQLRELAEEVASWASNSNLSDDMRDAVRALTDIANRDITIEHTFSQKVMRISYVSLFVASIGLSPFVFPLYKEGVIIFMPTLSQFIHRCFPIVSKQTGRLISHLSQSKQIRSGILAFTCLGTLIYSCKMLFPTLPGFLPHKKTARKIHIIEEVEDEEQNIEPLWAVSCTTGDVDHPERHHVDNIDYDRGATELAFQFERQTNTNPESKIISLSIIGVEQVGKSSLLNALFPKLDFKSGSGNCRTTRGVDCGVVKFEQLEERTVGDASLIVMDVEGIRSTKRRDAALSSRDNADQLYAVSVAQESRLCLLTTLVSDIYLILIKADPFDNDTFFAIAGFLKAHLALWVEAPQFFEHKNIMFVFRSRAANNPMSAAVDTFKNSVLTKMRYLMLHSNGTTRPENDKDTQILKKAESILENRKNYLDIAHCNEVKKHAADVLTLRGKIQTQCAELLKLSSLPTTNAFSKNLIQKVELVNYMSTNLFAEGLPVLSNCFQIGAKLAATKAVYAKIFIRRDMVISPDDVPMLRDKAVKEFMKIFRETSGGDVPPELTNDFERSFDDKVQMFLVCGMPTPCKVLNHGCTRNRSHDDAHYCGRHELRQLCHCCNMPEDKYLCVDPTSGNCSCCGELCSATECGSHNNDELVTCPFHLQAGNRRKCVMNGNHKGNHRCILECPDVCPYHSRPCIKGRGHASQSPVHSCGGGCPPPPRPPSPPRVDAGGSCIPASAVLETLEGGFKAASEVGVGDVVMTPSGWNSVYFMGHADHTNFYPYVHLTMDSKHEVSLSPDHYITVAGEARLAKHVEVAMEVTVWVNGEEKVANVTAVTHTEELGAFNPYTTSGDIIVNGVHLSCHSGWFLEDSAWVSQKNVPRIYQAVLAPLRGVHHLYPNVMKAFAEKSRGTTAVGDIKTKEIIKMSIDSFGLFSFP